MNVLVISILGHFLDFHPYIEREIYHSEFYLFHQGSQAVDITVCKVPGLSPSSWYPLPKEDYELSNFTLGLSLRQLASWFVII